MPRLDVLALILAGGAGQRLRPLTLHRCKPAVPFGATFRVIDFTLMNCVTSGIRQVYLLTRTRSEVLREHCVTRWRWLQDRSEGSVDVLPPRDPARIREGMYLGTADAVYQNLRLLELHRPRVVLVLSGDHVYHADFGDLLREHLACEADITVLAGRVPTAGASAFGVLDTRARRIRQFVEKPVDPSRWARGGHCEINLGIYCFDPRVLAALLLQDAEEPTSHHDFGNDVLPRAVSSGLRILAYPFRRISPGAYWRDVGTLSGLFEAHRDLVRLGAPFVLLNPGWPADVPFRNWLPRQTDAFVDAASRRHGMTNLVARNVLVGHSVVSGCVLSPGVRIDDRVELRECVVLAGARIGERCRLRRVIVEEGVEVPAGSEVSPTDASSVAVLARTQPTPGSQRITPRGGTLVSGGPSYS